MDLACEEGTDGVYQGRFVLVKYENDTNINIIYGFTNNSNTSGVQMYSDSKYQKPYIYTTYSTVQNPNPNDYQLYYTRARMVNGEYFYSRVPNPASVKEGITYYQKSNNAFNTVGINTIVYRKDSETNSFNGQFYICRGYTPDENNIALFNLITDYNIYTSYLSNFQIDAVEYGENFDYRGYDATVWEKVYSDGVGKFIQIARLNASIPNINIQDNKPEILPTGVTIDSNSTPEQYNIDVPSSWGFQLKEATNNDPPSELTYTQYYYNSNTQQPAIKENVNADFYLNIGDPQKPNYKSPRLYKTYDGITENKVNITPTGISGKKYDGQTAADTYELSVHLPAVGNMLSDGYDLIYGTDTEVGAKRPTDVNWYDGNSTDNMKTNGDSSLGGKTYDLKCLAGNINTMHNLLGQIVVDIGSNYNANSLSSNRIYRINNQLYRKGTVSIPHLINESEYFFVRQTEDISEGNFKRNKYYIVKAGETLSNNSNEWSYTQFEPAEEYDSTVNENHGYFLKNINRIRYSERSLIPFASRQYYWKSGKNYYCDNAVNIPTHLDRTYYTNIQTTTNQFLVEYAPYSFYVKNNDTGVYSLRESLDLNALEETYYTVTTSSLNGGTATLYYVPNHYYYKTSDGVLHFADDNHTYNSNYLYYYITFDEEKIYYGRDITGQIIAYYTIKDEVEVSFLPPPEGGLENVYIFYENQYIPYSQLSSLGILRNGRDIVTIPQTVYSLNTTSYSSDSIFFPNIYYTKSLDNSYILADEFDGPNTTYYFIDSVDTVNQSFYIPERYWYKISQDTYELDRSLSMTLNRQYYDKTSLYVYQDEEQQCPMGYEWNDYSPYVPPSITLCTFTTQSDLIRLTELDENTDSLYGLILKLNTLYNDSNEADRDITTIRGIYNNIKDALYQVKNLKPNQVLYANDFGQIETFNPGSNKILMTNELGQLKSISLSELKTQLNNA